MLDRLVLVVEGRDRDDRSEDLLVERTGASRGRREHRRREPEARAARVRAAERDLGASSTRRHALALARRDERAHLARLVGGIDDAHAPTAGSKSSMNRS